MAGKWKNPHFPTSGAHMPFSMPPRGLYLVTPGVADTARLVARVDAVLPSAVLLQYRNKSASPELAAEQASALQALCTAQGVPLIVNDDATLAARVGAAGVHLGETDGGLAAARAALGADAILGASCYDDLDLARAAVTGGASYVAFGALFPSSTKPLARCATPELLKAAAGLGVPRVAIGGIGPDNVHAAIDAGADLVAVISGVFDAPDPVAAARACAAAFA